MLNEASNRFELNPNDIREAWQNLSNFDLLAYGGNSYSERARFGSWPEVQEGALASRDGLSREGKISFGVGQKSNKRFIIFRQLQDRGRRGGYPYTALLSLNPEIIEKVQWNEALIIRNLLNNPELKQLLLTEPERIQLGDFRKLAEADWSIPQPKDPKTSQFLQVDDTGRELIILKASQVERPSPEVMAQVLSSFPEEQRKSKTYLIGGTKHLSEYFGTRVIWDEGL